MTLTLLLFSLLVSLAFAQNLNTYGGDFVIEFVLKTPDVFTKCSVQDTSSILDAIEKSMKELGNDYLEKFSFPGSFDTYVAADNSVQAAWVPPQRQLDSIDIQSESTDSSNTQNEHRILQWNFRIIFGGIWGCRICLADNSDKRRLQSGKTFRMNNLFNYINSRSRSIMRDAVSETSTTCQGTSSSWRLNVSQVVI